MEQLACRRFHNHEPAVPIVVAPFIRAVLEHSESDGVSVRRRGDGLNALPGMSLLWHGFLEYLVLAQIPGRFFRRGSHIPNANILTFNDQRLPVRRESQR